MTDEEKAFAKVLQETYNLHPYKPWGSGANTVTEFNNGWSSAVYYIARELGIRVEYTDS